MASYILLQAKVDSELMALEIVKLERGLSTIKRTVKRRFLKKVADDAKENLLAGKRKSKTPRSGFYYGRQYGRLTKSIRYNVEAGVVEAGGGDIYHAAIQDSDDLIPIKPTQQPKLVFIYWGMGAGKQLKTRYKIKDTRLVVTKGPVFRRGNKFLTNAWRHNVEVMDTFVTTAAREQGLTE